MYDIGQVLWVILDKTKSIEPVQVISKTTFQNLDGIVIQHNAQDIDGTVFCIEKLNATTFKTAEEAERHLLDLTADMVKKLLVTAKRKSEKFRPVSPPRSPVNHRTTSGEEKEQPTDFSVVELPDGRMARVHLPSELQ